MKRTVKSYKPATVAKAVRAAVLALHEADAAQAQAQAAEARRAAQAAEATADAAAVELSTVKAWGTAADVRRAEDAARRAARKLAEATEDAAQAEAEAAAVAIWDAQAAADVATGRPTVWAVYRERTAEDAAQAEAEKAEAAAVLALDKLAADATATAAAVKAARAAATAAHADAVAARKAARAAAEAAPRLYVPAAVAVDAHRPGRTLKEAHRLADAVAAVLFGDAAPLYVYRVYLDATAAPLATARAVAKRVAANGVQRQAGPTQISIDRAARSAQWDADGLADYVGAAAVAVAAVAATDAARTFSELATVYTATATALRELAATETAARCEAVKRGAAAADAVLYGAGADVVADVPTMRRRAELARLIAEAAAADGGRRAELATEAAYRAVNDAVAALRAVTDRTAAAPLSDVAETLADARPLYGADVADVATVERKAATAAALAVALPLLTARQRNALRALYATAGNVKLAAGRLHVTPPTMRKHRAAVAAVFAAAVASDGLAVHIPTAADVTPTEARATVARAAVAAVRREAAEAAGADVPPTVAAVLATMPPRMRDAAELALQGVSQRDAAARLNVTRKAVRHALCRAAAELAEAHAATAAALLPQWAHAVRAGNLPLLVWCLKRPAELAAEATEAAAK